jgi:hypothetical protein
MTQNVNEVQSQVDTNQPIEPVEKPKKSSKSTLLIVGVVVGLIVFLSCICVGVFVWIGQNESFLSGKMTEEEIEQAVKEIGKMIEEPDMAIEDGINLDDEWFGNTEGLGSVEEDGYTFYYPENYVAQTSNGIQEYVYFSTVENKNGDFNNISLSILSPGEEAIPECVEYSEFLAAAIEEGSQDDVDVDPYYATSIDRGGFTGCQMNFQITKGDTISYVDQSILQNFETGFAYLITVGYDTLLSDEYNYLKAAQSSFVIK